MAKTTKLFAPWPEAGSVRSFGRISASLGLILVAMSVVVDVFIAGWQYELLTNSIPDIQAAAAGSRIMVLQQQIASVSSWNQGMLALGFALILLGIFAVLARHLRIALEHKR